METEQISIIDYDYNLPDDRIAKYPLTERDSSKLLVYRKGDISYTSFSDLPDVLPIDTLLVRNNTRVIRARLLFRKDTGAQVEVFCLDPINPHTYELSLQSYTGCSWHCMLGNAKRWREAPLHKTIEHPDGNITLTAQRLDADTVYFTWDREQYTFGDILEFMGILPIPPYLNRDTEQTDLITYQTVYAREQGSVAAPTAGLHFTEKVNEALQRRGVGILDVTLHVGAGTFKPVKSDTIGEHLMHKELVIVDRDTLQKMLQGRDKRVVAVGTTSVRTLESLYWLGVKLMAQPSLTTEELCITQWEPYRTTQDLVLPVKEDALKALVSWLDRNDTSQLVFPTGILIAPGYSFRIVQGMITNFHQPRSTLLLLISAFIGEDWRRVYDYAMQNGFRFLSYGDSSLLLP